MQLTNLWQFFFNSAATSTASAEFDYDADAVGQVVAPAQAEDPARGWRFHAHAEVNLVRACATLRQVTVRGSASAPVQVIRASAQVAKTPAQAAGRAQATLLRGRASVAQVLASASSQHKQAPAAAHSRLVRVTGQANALSATSRLRTRALLRQVGVTIGPDLVEQELEEIMFLLEVA